MSQTSSRSRTEAVEAGRVVDEAAGEDLGQAADEQLGQQLGHLEVADDVGHHPGQPAPEGALHPKGLIEVLSFRVKGDQAFILYRSGDGQAWAFPMNPDRGRWWVSLLGPTPIRLRAMGLQPAGGRFRVAALLTG